MHRGRRAEERRQLRMRQERPMLLERDAPGKFLNRTALTTSYLQPCARLAELLTPPGPGGVRPGPPGDGLPLALDEELRRDLGRARSVLGPPPLALRVS